MRDGLKNKTVSFNTNDPIENAMYQYSLKMKDNKQSFGGLVKNLILSYMINMGEQIPGIGGKINITPHQPVDSIKKTKTKAAFTFED